MHLARHLVSNEAAIQLVTTNPCYNQPRSPLFVCLHIARITSHYHHYADFSDTLGLWIGSHIKVTKNGPFV